MADVMEAAERVAKVHLDLSGLGDAEARGFVASSRDAALEGVASEALLRELVARGQGVTASIAGERRTLTVSLAL